MQLPRGLDDKEMQVRWASILNPIIANPVTNPRILTDIALIIGANTINHGLDQMMQGWMILDINASAIVYRSQPLNDKTITLTSNAVAKVTLGVF